MLRRSRVRCDRSVWRRRRAGSFLSSFVLAAVTGACARSVGPNLVPLDRVAPAPTHASADRVERQEIGRLDAETLADAIMRLRPEWLRVSPSSPQATGPARAAVYVDGVYAGDPDVLRYVPVRAVIGVRYLRPSLASDRFGPGCRCGGGAILVATRQHGPAAR